jgi:nucleoside-diphosphate-sugar epimerase
MKRALVTGGAGFVGSNLSNKLLSLGWTVDIVDDLSSGKMDFVNDHGNLIFYRMDFVSSTIINNIKNNEYDIVFHLAALPKVSYSVENPILTHDVNLTKTLTLLDACRDNVERFVNVSSSAVYGANRMPTAEYDSMNPNSPYAIHKMTNESYAKLYSKLYGLETVSIRPFNIFGPNQLGDSAYSCAISSWLHAIKRGLPLRSDGDGTQSRDLIYVDDIVNILIKAAEHATPFGGVALNAGTGKSYSNNDILNWFKSRYYHLNVVNAPRRSGDVDKTLANMIYTKNVLELNDFTPFYDALEKTHDWAMNSPYF